MLLPATYTKQRGMSHGFYFEVASSLEIDGVPRREKAARLFKGQLNDRLLFPLAIATPVRTFRTWVASTAASGLILRTRGT